MSSSHRALGWAAVMGLISVVLWVGLAGLASAGDDGPGRRAPVAKTYQQGPLDDRDVTSIPELPSGAREVLGLSVVAAVLYGLRAAGLTRVSHRS